MANSMLFRSLLGPLLPATNARNEEHAPAYAFTPKQALAQYAATGCLNGTFYASAEAQLATVLELCQHVEAAFIARTALYSRQQGFMKDMPALLGAVLAVRDRALLESIFPRLMDNARMLRTFVQMVRSGVVGRKSFGTALKRLINLWLASREEEGFFRDTVGDSPSMADILKMVHPKPQTASREALYGYVLGRPHNAAALPLLVQQYEAFKGGARQEVPEVPLQMLTALNLGSTEWTAIARCASWQMTRMNLNTFARHGVFAQPEMVELLAARLRNPQAIARARVLPYQLLAASTTINEAVPQAVRQALHDAMEIAIGNVPTFPGMVYVCLDVSGSMSSPVSGFRKGATSKIRCIDVAALMAAAVVRKNRRAMVLPFEQNVVPIELDPNASVMNNATKLASIGGGGTNCSAPLTWLNRQRAQGNLVIFVSDNESWMDARRGHGTATMAEWHAFKRRNPSARLVCIDLQPYSTTQAQERQDIFNVGGFADAVFALIAEFTAGRLQPDHWVSVIEAVAL